MGARTLLGKIIEDAEAGEPSSRRALARPRLRPYLPGKTTARTLASGFGVLGRGLFRLLGKALKAAFGEQAAKPPAKTGKPATTDAKSTPGKAKKAPPPKATPMADMAERIAGGLLALGVTGVVAVGVLVTAGPKVAPYLPAAAGVGLVGLLIAAWWVAPGPAPKVLEQKPLEESKGLPEEDLLERDRITLLVLLEEVTRHRNGVHLGELYRKVAAHPLFAGLPRVYMGALLEAVAVPVQRTLSVDGIEGRSGVRRADVEALVLALPRKGQASPSQPSESGSDQQESQPPSDHSRAALGPISGGV